MIIDGRYNELSEECVQDLEPWNLEEIIQLGGVTPDEFYQTMEQWDSNIDIWMVPVEGSYINEQTWVFENMAYGQGEELTERDFLKLWIRWYQLGDYYGSRAQVLQEIYECYYTALSNHSDLRYYNGIESQAEEINNEIEALERLLNYYEEVREQLQNRIDSMQTDGGTSREDYRFEFLDVLTNLNSYIEGVNSNDVESGEFENKISIILTVVTNVGMIIAVLMSAIMGVKYMFASIEEKAEYKKDMVPYLIGAILLFGICTVVKVIQSIGDTINNI